MTICFGVTVTVPVWVAEAGTPPPAGFTPLTVVVNVAGVLAVAGCKVAVPTRLVTDVVAGGVVVVDTA